MTLKLDDTDNAIIDLLRSNGRMSNREVGRALQISEGTVRQRLKKLIESKAMRLGMVTDFQASGLGTSVILRIMAQPGQARAIGTRIAGLDACVFVTLTVGRFDLMAVLVTRRRTDAAEMIDNHIRNIPGVHAVEIQEPVSYARHRYDLVYIT